MKKLMIAAAIVCAAAFAQAGTVTWGNPMGINAINSPGDTGDLFSGTIYLVDGSSSSFFANIVAEDYASALASASVLANVSIDGTTMSNPSTGSINTDGYLENIAAATGSHSLFVTAIDGDGNFYISETMTDSVNEVGATEYVYYHDFAYDPGTVHNVADGYADAGWYSSVPEPTSGLLLLLGVAGLALRRRRA